MRDSLRKAFQCISSPSSAKQQRKNGRFEENASIQRSVYHPHYLLQLRFHQISWGQLDGVVVCYLNLSCVGKISLRNGSLSLSVQFKASRKFDWAIKAKSIETTKGGNQTKRESSTTVGHGDPRAYIGPVGELNPPEIKEGRDDLLKKPNVFSHFSATLLLLFNFFSLPLWLVRGFSMDPEKQKAQKGRHKGRNRNVP